MTTPPSDEIPPPSGVTARLRARAHGPAVRPEVLQALEQLESNLGDVGRWEQLLAGQEERRAPAPPVIPPPPGAPGVIPPPPGAPGAPTEPLLRYDQPSFPAPGDQAGDVLAGGAPLLVEFSVDETDGVPPPADTSVLWLARPSGSDPPPPPPPGSPEDLAQRRRKGRILSWVGVALVIVAAGYFAFRDDDGATDTNETPVSESSVTTARRSTTTTRLAPASSVPTVPTSAETTTPTVTSTTRRPTTATTARPTTGTTAVPPTTAFVTPTTSVNPSRPAPGSPPLLATTTTTTTTPSGGTDGGSTGGAVDGFIG